MGAVVLLFLLWGGGAGGSGVEEEGGGAVVLEGDLHVGAEEAGGEGDFGFGEACEEEVEEGFGLFWRGGGAEAGAAALGGFGGEGEVGDDEERALGAGDVEVVGFVALGEDAEGEEFLGGPVDIEGGIVGVDGDEHEEATGDLADGVVVDDDGGGGDTLDDGEHGNSGR